MSNNKPEKSNKMWGGRFDALPDDVMTQINASIDIDKRLYKQDISGSKAHAAMLVKQGIIPAKDGDAIQTGLDQILEEIESGQFTFSTALEDIHMNIESRLKEIIGDSAGKLHTARSRNDQVALDFKLWVREACDALHTKIESVQGTIEKLVAEHKQTIMPGFTHLQVAQPVTLALHLDSYWHMLNR
ncbi:MAG TPA: lyase family protein, partial [Alphaproteobacteria bacterium]|nr:lyase family protein [Alphaproteobacteria bacterium]